MLCIPSYPQNIFSVHGASEKGVSVNIYPNYAELITQNGTKFKIRKDRKLYYLNNVVTYVKHACDLKKWNSILGHCNQNVNCKPWRSCWWHENS